MQHISPTFTETVQLSVHQTNYIYNMTTAPGVMKHSELFMIQHDPIHNDRGRISRILHDEFTF